MTTAAPALPVWTVPDLAGCPHGFTTRAGGVSTGPTATANLAVRGGDGPEIVVENWRRAVRAVAPDLGPERVAVLNQIHGAEVVRVERGSGPLDPVADADAAFTTAVDVVLGVRVADCVPVLVAGPGVVGVAHAGWRGVAAGVVPALITAIEAAGIPASALKAAIGPCISGDVYEVGPEVVDGLRGAGLAPGAVVAGVSDRGRTRVDLGRAVAVQLAVAGVPSVARITRCTATDPVLYSHRRDGDATGRSAGLVVRRSP